jgi:Mannosyl-glycoprotein endo-beta-N-acetylglucosaminidase
MSAAAQHNMKVFTKKYGNDMLVALNNSGIYFPLMLAQASIESGYGTSSAALYKNNFFGVLSGNTPRRFARPADAFAKQVSLFYNSNLPYLSHGVTNATSPYDQARRIADSGYYSMNNDETLTKADTGNCTWNGSRWVGCNFTKKQSADHYYKTLKSMIDNALIAIPFGKITDFNLAQSTNYLTQNIQI